MKADKSITITPIPRDKEFSLLLSSGAAIFSGLLWMFFGNNITNSLIPHPNQVIFYYFFSGVIFSLAIVGLYAFMKTILCYAEFMTSQGNLSSIMYDNLLNEEHEGAFLKNKNGVYKIISPVAQVVLKLKDKQVIGHTDIELHDYNSANKIIHEDHRVLEFGETIIWETTQNIGNGDEYYLCKKFPCRDKRGHIIGIVGVCKDITVLKTFKNLNQQLEDRYQNLFNKLPYPVLVLDAISMQPFTFNDAMCKLLDYDKNEFSRMRMSLHIDPEELSKFQHTISHIQARGGGEFETVLVNKHRDTVNVNGYAQEIIIGDKNYLHVMLYDTTETKKSTEILISSELKYRSLFEHANDAIVVVSPNSMNIIDANEIAISFLGYTRDDIMLMSIQDLDASPDHSFTQEKIADLEIYNHSLYEHKIKNRKGDVLEVEINAHKLNYGNEDVYQFVIRSISARKKTEAALRASESRYRQMFESNMAIKLVIDPDNFTIEDANPAAAEFYGYSIENLRGMDLSRINILSREKLNTIIQQTREQNLGFYSCPHRLSNGEIRFVEVRDGPMAIEGKQLFYSIIHDVTASKEAESQVLVASKMFDYSTDAVMLINDHNEVVSVNYAFTQITGFQQSEIQHAQPEVILSNKSKKLLSNYVLDEIKKSGQWKGEIWHRLKSGQSRPLSATINSIRDDNSDASSYVVMMTSKSSQILEQENLIHYVELTELPSKSLFIDRLSNAIGRAKRNKNRLGIMQIDFRNFSEINTNYGFDVGDKILKAISNRLKYNTRNSDTVSHFSSDDFAVLIEDLADIQQIGIVAQKLLSTLSEAYQTDNYMIDMDVSMGISIYPEDGTDTQQLLARSQTALLTAKQYTGNHFELTNDKMNQAANVWLQAEASLHQALRLNQLFVEFLPLIDVQRNSLISLEALVRWNHPEKGILYPGEFLPGAEQSGFIGAVGLNIFEQSLCHYRFWLNQNLAVPRLELNVCSTQLDIDIIDVLLQKTTKYDIKPSQIGLAFPDESFISATDEHKLILKQLRQEGFHIIVDDFGSVSTSLSCLLQCRVDEIKIHQQLILQAQQTPEANDLLGGLVSLCKTLSIKLVAEGVESADVSEYLTKLGIFCMQGSYLSKPISANEIPSFIQKIN